MAVMAITSSVNRRYLGLRPDQSPEHAASCFVAASVASAAEGQMPWRNGKW